VRGQAVHQATADGGRHDDGGRGGQHRSGRSCHDSSLPWNSFPAILHNPAEESLNSSPYDKSFSYSSAFVDTVIDVIDSLKMV
jgi:hypothetical protein